MSLVEILLDRRPVASSSCCIVIFGILRVLYRVAEPNEALIISGLGVRVDRSDTADSLASRSSPAGA